MILARTVVNSGNILSAVKHAKAIDHKIITINVLNFELLSVTPCQHNAIETMSR